MSDSPLDILLDLEVRAQNDAFPIPAEEDTKEEWVGIAFHVGGQSFVASMGEVVEILNVPPVTKVPGVKSWVVGMANIRGNLLPIMDLGGYLLNTNAEISNQLRVLALNLEGVYTGLLVDSVQGLRHFFVEEKEDLTQDIAPEFKPFCKNSFTEAGVEWPVFDMRALVRANDFIEVSSH